MKIGNKIRRLRLQRGLTQEEVADRCELSKSFISLLERDLTSPSLDTLSDLLGWRRYLRTLTPNLAQQLLEADPQYYYRTALFAEALGVGGSFTRAFEGQKMSVCSFFERAGKPAPRSAAKFRELLLDTLASARGESGRRSAKKKAPPRDRRDRPDRPERREHAEAAAERVRNNNPRRRTVEVYDPEEEF